MRRRALGCQDAAVVVQEGRQVHAAVLLSQDERKEIRLTQLVGPGPLEGADLVRVRSGRFLHEFVAGLVVDLCHDREAGPLG